MPLLNPLSKDDRPLRVVALGIAAGMFVLFAGLWYVQIVRSKQYVDSLKVQSFRTVRLPAIRGKIMDRNGFVLAENHPRFDLNLYLDELRPVFRYEYTNSVKKEFLALNPGKKLSRTNVLELEKIARYRAAHKIASKVSDVLGLPITLDQEQFDRHYRSQLALPFVLIKNLPAQYVALFLERAANIPGVDLEIQPLRTYPHAASAAHLLGYLQREDNPLPDEEIFFKYRLPDYVGRSGVEARFDEELRGKAGVKSMLVNNIGYRQREEIWPEAEPGANLVLTIDLPLQQAAEKALRDAGADTRGAAVVMDAQSGDIFALASSPAYDPNKFITGVSVEEWEKMSDPMLAPQLNRAAYGAYPPGSIFKIIVGLACLENGLNPDEIYLSKGYVQIGRRIKPWGDTAGPGEFDFRRAFYKSSNPYFIEHGLAIGVEKVIDLGRQFGLGQRTGYLMGQEAAGYFPQAAEFKKDGTRWQDGDTANLCIGQGEITVTPLQMAVMTAAVANGGRVLQPQILEKVESQDTLAELAERKIFPKGQVLNHLPVSQRSLAIVREAMLADVEEPEGTGRQAFLPDLQVSGKTGTAQVRMPKGGTDHIVWFVSFAPFDHPQYVVVVVIESGSSGGGTCAPIARQIYRAIQKRNQLKKPERTIALSRDTHP